jgi:hypothetical protein
MSAAIANPTFRQSNKCIRPKAAAMTLAFMAQSRSWPNTSQRCTHTCKNNFLKCISWRLKMTREDFFIITAAGALILIGALNIDKMMVL